MNGLKNDLDFFSLMTRVEAKSTPVIMMTNTIKVGNRKLKCVLSVVIDFIFVLIGLAIVVALFTKLVLGQLADVTTVVIAMTAAHVAVVGLLAELINRRSPNYYREES